MDVLKPHLYADPAAGLVPRGAANAYAALRRHEGLDLTALRSAGRTITRSLPGGGSIEQVEKDLAIEGYDAESKAVDIIASDETSDRMGDVIVAAGWQLENFEKNPVLLIDHSYRIASIVGSADVKLQKKRLRAKGHVDEHEENVNARMVQRLLESGLLKTVSVGFLPLEWELIEDRDGRVTGFRFTKQELLEISFVAVPANPNALISSLEPAPAASGLIAEPNLCGLQQLATKLLAAGAACS